MNETAKNKDTHAAKLGKGMIGNETNMSESTEKYLEDMLIPKRREKKKEVKKEMPKTICGLEYSKPTEISASLDCKKRPSASLSLDLSSG